MSIFFLFGACNFQKSEMQRIWKLLNKLLSFSQNQSISHTHEIALYVHTFFFACVEIWYFSPAQGSAHPTGGKDLRIVKVLLQFQRLLLFNELMTSRATSSLKQKLILTVSRALSMHRQLLDSGTGQLQQHAEGKLIMSLRDWSLLWGEPLLLTQQCFKSYIEVFEAFSTSMLMVYHD